jgi:pimeloyl-ACP methyl ester carboxylesterase
MPRISRQMKEIINTVIFLLVVAALVACYVIYPLNRVRTSMGRTNLDDYNADSLAVNDATAYIEIGLNPDTFRVESDGLTTLACLYIAPNLDSVGQTKGTVFLVHQDGANRDAMAPLARLFVDSGFAVVAFDQRASGRSTGEYHGEGQYEASDLNETIRYLDLRERIIHPLITIGYSLGADGGLLAALEEKRINGVVAINPYLTTRRMQDILKERYDMLWFPFFRTIMWWWYNIRSSYAAPYRDTDGIEAVACRTLLLTTPQAAQDDEVQRIKELSPPELLECGTIPASEEELHREILRFAISTTSREL